MITAVLPPRCIAAIQGIGSHLPARRGSTLAELLAALTLSALLAALVGGMLAAQLRLARNVSERVAATETIRIAVNVMAGEAARTGAVDVRAMTGDSLSLRGFRGAAVPCAHTGRAVIARYRGDRLPDPTKDSVLVVVPDGGHATVALLSAAPTHDAGCAAAPGETVLALEFDGTDTVGLLLFFESGSYYLASGALRYRLGAEGRQPLTTESLAGTSRFHTADAAGIALLLHTRRGDVVAARASFAAPAP